MAQNKIETPFSLLQAAQSISSVKKAKVEQFHVISKKEVCISLNFLSLSKFLFCKQGLHQN